MHSLITTFFLLKLILFLVHLLFVTPFALQEPRDYLIDLLIGSLILVDNLQHQGLRLGTGLFLARFHVTRLHWQQSYARFD